MESRPCEKLTSHHVARLVRPEDSRLRLSLGPRYECGSEVRVTQKLSCTLTDSKTRLGSRQHTIRKSQLIPWRSHPNGLRSELDQLFSGRRRARLDHDQRPVVYLRRFADDGLGFPGARWLPRRQYEAALCRALRPLGPVVSLPNPIQPSLPSGSMKMGVTSESDWQDAVRELLARAILVVINIGVSAGLSWEVRLTFRQLRSEKILLFLPPRHRRTHFLGALFGQKGGARLRYQNFADEFTDCLPKPLPMWQELPQDTLFLVSDDRGNWNQVPGVRRWWRSSGEYARYNVAKSLKPLVTAYLATGRVLDGN